MGKIFGMDAWFTAYENEVSLDPLMAYNNTVDPNNIYLDEAMKQTNSNKFKKSMQKEWDDQIKIETSESYPNSQF